MKSALQKLAPLTIWLILAVALILRLPLLGGSFWLDEAAQALESIRPFSQQLDIAEDFQPPLLHILLHFVAQLSHAEWWLRLFGALLPGLLTIWASYKIAERLFSQRVAMLTALLIATSSFHIFYSQELRQYSLSAGLATLSWLILITATFQTKKFSTRHLFWYTLTTTVGLYSTYLYPFLVISQICYVFWKERTYFLKYILSIALSGLLFLPWLPNLYQQLQVGQTLRSSLPGWENVVSIPQLKSIPLTFGKFIFGVLDIQLTPFFLLAIAIFLLSLAWGVKLLWQRARDFVYSKPVVLLLCWFCIPLLTAWLVSFAIPVIQPKRVLYLLPGFYMLITAAVIQLRAQRAILVGTIGLLLALNCYATLQYYLEPSYQREDWRQLHQKITTEYPSDAAVIFAFDAAFAPWQWYDDGRYPVFSTGNLTQGTVASVEDTLKKTSQYSYLLVFDYLRDLTDPDRKIEAALHNLGYAERNVFGLPGIGFVRVFTRQEDVLS